MKIKTFKPFLWLGTVILMVSLACSITSPQANPTQPPTQPEKGENPAVVTQETQPVVTEAPTAVETEAVQPSDPLLITKLEDLNKAVVNISIEGSFRDPEAGWQFNSYRGGDRFYHRSGWDCGHK